MRGLAATASGMFAGAEPARRAALAALLAAVLASLLASSAGALIVRPANGPVLSYAPVPGAALAAAPFDAIFHNVDYNGGPVMASNTNYTFYWAPGAGEPAYPSDYQPGIDRFFSDLAHDSGGHENVDSVAAQYNDSLGHHASYSSSFGGAIVDTDPYPANGCTQAAICLTDAQIRAELAAYATSHHLPGDLAHEYFVLTPPGVESCLEAAGELCSAGSAKPSFCAYHGAIPLTGATLVYADVPFLAGGPCDDANHPNATTADAAIEGGLSHEHDESITDPQPNGAWTDWASGSSTGYEIADKCRTFSAASEYGAALGTAPDGASYNQLINGDEYWLQQEWSNQGHACLQRLTPGAVEPHAAFRVASDETEATLDASASTAPGGVGYYEWQPGGPGGGAPFMSTTPVSRWRFPSAGVYDIALTVFAADGSSNGTAAVVTLGAAPSVKRLAPRSGPTGGGTAVTITGTHFDHEVRSVAFGSQAAKFSPASATRIIATAPAHGAGAVDVIVTTGAGASVASARDRFTYAPTVTDLNPSAGARRGGTAVTVTGTGFAIGTSATAFYFGSTAARAVDCATQTTCTMLTPPHSAGTLDVKATVAAATSARAAGDTFTYR